MKCDGLSFTAVSGGAGDTPKSSSSVEGKSSSSNGQSGKSSSSNGQGGKSSSSTTPTLSSSSVAPVITDIKVIDDFEDGDEVASTTGTWYAYTDKEPGGLSKISNVYDNTLGGYVVVFPGTADAANGTKGFAALTEIEWNQGTYKEAPFVALGLNTHADTSKGVDLSACSALSYRYRGSAHTFKVQDGQVADYAYHQINFEDALEWTTVVASWDDIAQPSWGEPVDLNKKNIKKFAWEVIGYKNIEYQPTINFLFVDDFKCVDASVGVRMAKAASPLKLSVNGSTLNVTTAAAARIQVFDMQGNMVMNRLESAAGNHQVSLEGMNRGNYVVRVKSAGIAKTARISIR